MLLSFSKLNPNLFSCFVNFFSFLVKEFVKEQIRLTFITLISNICNYPSVSWDTDPGGNQKL